MQIASSASWAARLSRSASEYATTASTPSVRQARRIRSAISPRLAIRILRNIRPRPRRGSRGPGSRARPGGRGQLDADQLLAVLDRGAALHERRRDDAVAGRHDLLRNPEDVHGPERFALADARARGGAGAGVEDAHGRRVGDMPVVLGLTA